MKSKIQNSLQKRQVVLALLVMIVLTAGLINWANNGIHSIPTDAGETTAKTPVETDYFAGAIKDRDDARGKALELLENSEQDDKTTAAIRQIARDVQNEATAEGLIKAKGIEKAVVYITDGVANVVVKANGLTSAQVSQIKDIVTSTAGISPSRVKIAEFSGV